MGNLDVVLKNEEARFFLTLLIVACAFVWILSSVSNTAPNGTTHAIERPHRKRRPAIRRRGSSLSSTGSGGEGTIARALGILECPPPHPQAFRLQDLPSELILDILETSALRWPGTFGTLRLVSRRLNALADRACLIHVPVLLTSAHRTLAFRAFLDARPRALPYVRHLWVGAALDAADAGGAGYVAAIVVRRCANLRSLACTARMLYEAIAHAPRWRTERCRRLTILAPPSPALGSTPHEAAGAGDVWDDLRGNATAASFIGRVTHVRISGAVPSLRDGLFSRVSHLSIAYDGPAGQITRDMGEFVDDAKTQEKLKRVVVTVRGMSKTVPYGDEWKSRGQRWMVLGLPQGWAEVDMWKNDIRGRGLWEIASGRLCHL
ncbi:hypothetical protein HDZ31DRAFT_82168 [Schizophyllum fasciatum]